jgi:hypothetical protein
LMRTREGGCRKSSAVSKQYRGGATADGESGL